eukprot:432410_1
MIFGNIIFNENIEPIFNNMNLNLISNNIIKCYSSSALLSNSNSSYKLFLQTNKYCLKTGEASLTMLSTTFLKTLGGSMIEYYGGDILFTDTTSYINSTESTIIISERCSSTYSMAIGGTTTPSDNNTYNLNLLHVLNVDVRILI